MDVLYDRRQLGVAALLGRGSVDVGADEIQEQLQGGDLAGRRAVGLRRVVQGGKETFQLLIRRENDGRRTVFLDEFLRRRAGAGDDVGRRAIQSAEIDGQSRPFKIA